MSNLEYKIDDDYLASKNKKRVGELALMDEVVKNALKSINDVIRECESGIITYQMKSELAKEVRWFFKKGDENNPFSSFHCVCAYQEIDEEDVIQEFKKICEFACKCVGLNFSNIVNGVSFEI